MDILRKLVYINLLHLNFCKQKETNITICQQKIELHLESNVRNTFENHSK